VPCLQERKLGSDINALAQTSSAARKYPRIKRKSKRSTATDDACRRQALAATARQPLGGVPLSFEASQAYPFPEALSDPDRNLRFHYELLAYTEENKDVFLKILDDEKISYFPLPDFFVTATALRLTRALSY